MIIILRKFELSQMGNQRYNVQFVCNTVTKQTYSIRITEPRKTYSWDLKLFSVIDLLRHSKSFFAGP